MTNQTPQTTPTPKQSIPRVEGISFNIPGSALAAQAATRIEWYKRSAASMTIELEALPKVDSADLKTVEDLKNDRRRHELTRRIAEHEEQARFLEFVVRHLESGHLYHVTIDDLRDLEITPKQFLL